MGKADDMTRDVIRASIFKYDRFEDCPDAARYHAKGMPSGYLERAEWSERKSRTHVQQTCPTCGFWVVYKRVRPGRIVVRRAIAILGEAARTDGMVLMAADRLGLYPSKASALALRAFYAEPIQGTVIHGHSRQRRFRQPEACGAAESLMLAGWVP